MPKSGSVIKPPRDGKIKKRGASEFKLEDCIRLHLSDTQIQLFPECFMMRGSGIAPYEPDLTLQDEKSLLHNGKLFNLFIDLEIDEPYDFINLKPMHCKGDDIARDKYFNKYGWIVIRFSEKQVITNTNGCVLHIAKVIRSIAPEIFSIPSSLNNVIPLETENFWNMHTAQVWAKSSYRQTYLTNYSAIPQQMEVEFGYENLKLNETEKEAEKIAFSNKIFGDEKPLSGKSWNIRNAHPRDEYIKFYPNEHRYEYRNNTEVGTDGDFEYSSASSIAKLFFTDFDEVGQAQRLAIKRNTTPEEVIRGFRKDRDLGIQLHRDIEEWLANNNYKPSNDTLMEFNFFVDFYNQNLKNKTLYRTEWPIYDKIYKVAGTVDMVIQKSDGDFAIYDWKRSSRFFKNPTEKGREFCSLLPDGNFSIYTLQLHIYKKILQHFYGIKKVSELFLVQLHPTPYNNSLKANLENISNEVLLEKYGVNIDEVVDTLFKIVKP